MVLVPPRTFFSQGALLCQDDWEKRALDNQEVVDWCAELADRCYKCYKLHQDPGDKLPCASGNSDEFPQWKVETAAGSNATGDLLALGRVRPAGEGEESFDAVVEVVFRGSVNLANWATNITASLEPAAVGKERGQVHSGFQQAYKMLQPSIEAEVVPRVERMHAKPGKVLIMTGGHSLGGALATLAAYDLAGRHGWTAFCTTFGSPRVGDQEFRNAYRGTVGRTLRFINKFDPVPRLPPSTEDAIVNDADAFHAGIATLLGAVTTRAGAAGYRHVVDYIQLDEGIAASLDHYAGIAGGIAQKFRGTPAEAPRDGCGTTDPAPHPGSSDPCTRGADPVGVEKTLLPHAMSWYLRNMQGSTRGSARQQAPINAVGHLLRAASQFSATVPAGLPAQAQRAAQSFTAGGPAQPRGEPGAPAAPKQQTSGGWGKWLAGAAVLGTMAAAAMAEKPQEERRSPEDGEDQAAGCSSSKM